MAGFASVTTIGAVRKRANFSAWHPRKRNGVRKFGTRLTGDDPGETQNISSREVRVILLRITVIFRLVASRRFDFETSKELRLSRFRRNRDGCRAYSSSPFLIIRARKHHREIIAAERNRDDTAAVMVADRYATAIRETRADAESVVLAR